MQCVSGDGNVYRRRVGTRRPGDRSPSRVGPAGPPDEIGQPIGHRLVEDAVVKTVQFLHLLAVEPHAGVRVGVAQQAFGDPPPGVRGCGTVDEIVDLVGSCPLPWCSSDMVVVLSGNAGR
jgi:hypothetical protein